MFATYFISGSISSWRPGLQMNESHLGQFGTNGWEIEAMLEISRLRIKRMQALCVIRNEEYWLYTYYGVSPVRKLEDIKRNTKY